MPRAPPALALMRNGLITAPTLLPPPPTHFAPWNALHSARRFSYLAPGAAPGISVATVVLRCDGEGHSCALCHDLPRRPARTGSRLPLTRGEGYLARPCAHTRASTMSYERGSKPADLRDYPPSGCQSVHRADRRHLIPPHLRHARIEWLTQPRAVLKRPPRAPLAASESHSCSPRSRSWPQRCA